MWRRTRLPSWSVGEGAAVNNQWFSKIAVWLVVALVLFTVFKQFDRVRLGVSGSAIPTSSRKYVPNASRA
jgi:hypothetical protein